MARAMSNSRLYFDIAKIFVYLHLQLSKGSSISASSRANALVGARG
jgi:hypothetical protein